jgi:carbamate kinase
MVRIVMALGGNALLQRGQPMTAENQQASARVAAEALAPLARDHQLVITHGNGPQVGLLALESDAYRDVKAYPLDILGAESQGMIGYLIEREFDRVLQSDPPVVSLLTQVEVDPDDPAFKHPTKFIGPIYDKAEAESLTDERGWIFKQDGSSWRRVVPSPLPKRILDVKVIDLLLQHNIAVICVGGGGIPVMERNGELVGVEVVIDKDRAGALLALTLDADAYVMLTDVPAVYINYGEPNQQAIRRASPDALEALSFPAGSMGPKIEAACAFARTTGKPTLIGSLHEARAVIGGDAGTWVTPSVEGVEAVPVAATV